MRVSEIFALEWSGISFDTENISITKSASIKVIIKEPKTKAEIRYLEMATQAKEALTSQYLITGKGNGPVFLTSKSRSCKKPVHFVNIGNRP